MKDAQFTQTYELTITVNVEVPDDWSETDIQEQMTDFPITVDVDDFYEQMYENINEKLKDAVNIVGLSVDGLVTVGYPDHIITETE